MENTPKADIRPSVDLRVPAATILKIVSVLLLFYALYLLVPFLKLFFMSILLAVTLKPAVDRIAKKAGQGTAVFLVAGLIGLLMVLIAFIVSPVLVEQFTGLYHQLPELEEGVGHQFPQFKSMISHWSGSSKDGPPVAPVLGGLATVGGFALGGLSSVVLVYVFMLYLLIHGQATYEWFVAFFRTQSRIKIEETCKGVAPVISAYITGQAVTSVLCSIFTFVTLTVIGVQGAVVLAVLAGIFDILPVIGFFLFTIPSVLFALTVSPTAAIIVFVSFLLYHQIETYLICPWVYGSRLRVSGFVVLFSLVVGAILGGILGAIAILPIVASYPVIERIWLGQYLGEKVLKKHAESEAS